jgi:hypothetical protein
MQKPAFIFLWVFALLALRSSCALAQEEGGLPLTLETRVFTVTSDCAIDCFALAKKIDYEYMVQTDDLSSVAAQDSAGVLARSIDGLFAAVSDALDIRILRFRGRIFILPDRPSLKEHLKRVYGLELSERSYYFYRDNTIFIAYEDLNARVLAHEMAHALISNYFQVPPPEKIQEILASYAEKNLR